MKKAKVLVMTAIIIMTIAILSLNVNAVEKHNLSFNTYGLPIDVHETSWDEANGIHYAEGTITLTDDNLNAILNQVSGANSSLASYYIGVTLDGYNASHPLFEKSGSWVKKDVTDIAAIKEAAQVQITPGAGVDSSVTGWSTAVMIEYSTDNGATWQLLGGAGDGSTSGRAALQNVLGTTDLVYGQNYRIIMVEDQKAVSVWVDKTDGVRHTENDEFVVISYTLKFPVNGSFSNGTAMYAQNVNQALNLGSTRIVVNNTSSASAVTIPAGTTLEVAPNVTLNVSELTVNGNLVVGSGATVKSSGNVTIGSNANVTNSGSILASDSVPVSGYTVTVAPTENGTVKVSKNSAYVGQEIDVTIIPDSGYVLDAFTITDESGKDVTSTVSSANTIIMPAYNIKVNAKFKVSNSNKPEETTKPEEVKKPETNLVENVAELQDTTGNTVVVANTENAKVESSNFKTAKADNKAIKVLIPNRIAWEFSAFDLSSNPVELNPYVTVSNTKFDEIKSTAVKDGTFIDFSHSGKLPGKAKVTLNVGTEKFGKTTKTLHLYYYNPTTKGYEYQGTATYNNGVAKFELIHCSNYVLTENRFDIPAATAIAGVAPAPAAIAATGTLDNEPKAGEASIMPIALLSLVSLAVMVYTKK